MERFVKIKNFIADTVIYAAEYILALFVILGCNSVFGAIAGRYELALNLQNTMLSYGALLAVALLIRRQYQVKNLVKDLIILVPLEVVLLICYLYNTVDTIAAFDYKRAFFQFFPLMLLVFSLEKESGRPYRFFYVLSDIVVFLAVSSVIAWISTQFLGNTERWGTITLVGYNEWPVMNAANLGFFWARDWTFFRNLNIMRNASIFTEPLMFNLFLCISLATELFLREKTPVIRTAILALANLTTFGTLGILIMLGVFGLKTVSWVSDKKRTKKILLIVSASLLILLVIFLIHKMRVTPESFNAHMEDYIGCLNAWKAHPFMGCGWNREDLVGQYFNPPRVRYGIANSVALILAEGGIVLSTFYLMPFIVLIFLQIKGIRQGVGQWALVVVALFCVVIFGTTFFMITILAFGYAFIKDITDIKLVNNSIKNLQEKQWFWGDKGFIIYIVIVIIISLIIMYTNILEKHELLLEQRQWAFVNMFAYGMWGLGLLNSIWSHRKNKKVNVARNYFGKPSLEM